MEIEKLLGTTPFFGLACPPETHSAVWRAAQSGFSPAIPKIPGSASHHPLRLSHAVRSPRERIRSCRCLAGFDVSPVSSLAQLSATTFGQSQKALEKPPPRNGSIARLRRNSVS